MVRVVGQEVTFYTVMVRQYGPGSREDDTVKSQSRSRGELCVVSAAVLTV